MKHLWDSASPNLGIQFFFIPFMDNSHIWEPGSLWCSHGCSHGLGLSLNPKKSQSRRKTSSQIPDFIPSRPPSSASEAPKAFPSPGSSEPTFPAWKSQKIPDHSWEKHKNPGMRGCPAEPILELLCLDKPGILAPCQAWERFSFPKTPGNW